MYIALAISIKGLTIREYNNTREIKIPLCEKYAAETWKTNPP